MIKAKLNKIILISVIFLIASINISFSALITPKAKPQEFQSKPLLPKKDIKSCDMVINNKLCELKAYRQGKLTINNTKDKNYLQKAYNKIKNLYLVYYETKDNHITYDTMYKAIGLKSFDIFKKNIKIYKSKSKGSVEVFFNPVTDVEKVFKQVKEVN